MDDFPLLEQTVSLDHLPARVSAQCLRQDTSFHMHRHTQLVYNLSGELSHRIRNEHFAHTKGAVASILPYTPHSTSLFNSEDTPVIIFISFFDDFLQNHGYDFFPFGKNPHFEGHKIPYFSLPESIEAEIKTSGIVREMRNEFKLAENTSFDRIAELLAELFRCICREKLQAHENALSRRQSEGITAAVKHIEQNFREKITIDTLADLAEMSRSTFTSRFREFTGLSVSDFLLSVRLYRASKLMLFQKDEHSMDEIAEKCGLYDHTNLVRVFRKAFGVTPTHFTNVRINHQRTNEAAKESNGFDLGNWIL